MYHWPDPVVHLLVLKRAQWIWFTLDLSHVLSQVSHVSFLEVPIYQEDQMA